VGAVLAAMRRNGWLAPAAVLAVERATRGGPFRWPAGVKPLRSRRYGEGTLWYGRASS
jgi:16S rRNA (guanine966-N2)-methyltransferase